MPHSHSSPRVEHDEHWGRVSSHFFLRRRQVRHPVRERVRFGGTPELAGPNGTNRSFIVENMGYRSASEIKYAVWVVCRTVSSRDGRWSLAGTKSSAAGGW